MSSKKKVIFNEKFEVALREYFNRTINNSTYEDILEKLPNIMVSPETVKLSKVIVNILKQSTEIATEFRHSWVSVDHIFLVLLDNLDKWPRKVVSVFNIDLAVSFVI